MTVTIKNPTEFDVALEKNRISIEHEETVVANTFLSPLKVPGGGTLEKRIDFKLSLLPQALANVMPPLLGQTAVLIKDTSLLSIIAVFELMGAGLRMFSETVIATESYVTTAVCYLLIYAMMLVISGMLQNKLGGKAWQAN